VIQKENLKPRKKFQYFFRILRSINP